LGIIDEVCALRGMQEEMAVQCPDDPRRLFGEAVEAASGSNGIVGEQLARLCTDIVTHALPAVIDKLAAYIDERLAHVESRQHVNLNVRAPKRPAPHNPPIASDIAGVGRPFPVAKFLDQKEREGPSCKCARRSFAPTFGMQVHVLKKKKLKDEGAQPVYVEQNHRAPLLYTEEDREVM